MIKTDSNGGIVVEANGQSYNLSNTEQYTAFLMWLTSPDESTVIPSDAFTIKSDLPEDLVAKAKRYSGFLEDFAKRRTAKLEELSESLTNEQREAAISKFIATLNGEDE